MPHHVTQRGNRRQQTFFGDGDYRAYLGLLRHWCLRQGWMGGWVCTWGEYLRDDRGEGEVVGRELRRHDSTGRPLGDKGFVAKVQAAVGRELGPRKRGPKPKSRAASDGAWYGVSVIPPLSTTGQPTYLAWAG